MKSIKGLTKKETIDILEKYLLDSPTDYICNYIEERVPTHRMCINRFINHWVNKIYGNIQHSPHSGYFGNCCYDENRYNRLAFVTLLINELENN